MDSGKQTEGFRREGGGRMGETGDGYYGGDVLHGATGCYMQTMNHGTLHQTLMMYCTVTNVTLKKKIYLCVNGVSLHLVQ